VLKKKSEKRGALELETSEAEIVLSEDGTPTDIIKRERGDAEKLIEQFMLCANEAVATLLYENKIPCVYRVHENPTEEKLSEFLTFAHNLGFDTSYISREKSTPSDFSLLLSEARERGILAPMSYTMLRSMAKAKYSEVKDKHFGLAIDCYCHFTSPIRRLSDLATHRIIHKVLMEGKRAELYSGYAKRAAAAATEAEIRALSAERRIENLYKVIYMEKFIGREFDAMISSVTSFGFFAELENTCEGLVPISELPGMFIFDEKNITLRSRETVYRLGDFVRVRLEEADIIRGKLRFSVV
jgi:ribonuclease R